MNIRKILYQDFETKIAKNRVELADLMISDKEGSRLNKDKMTTYNLLGFIERGKQKRESGWFIEDVLSIARQKFPEKEEALKKALTDWSEQRSYFDREVERTKGIRKNRFYSTEEFIEALDLCFLKSEKVSLDQLDSAIGFISKF